MTMLDQTQSFEGLGNWIARGAQGASAGSIAAHLAEHGEQTGAYPRDAGDFARCEALLEAVPTLRDIFDTMADVNAYWAALVPNWGRIRVSDNQTDLIKAIVGPIQQSDPDHIQFNEGVDVRIGGNELGGSAQSKGIVGQKNEDDGGSASYRVAASELRQFIERIERLEAEKKDIADQQKEVYAEAKARGYMVMAMRKLIAERKKDPDERSELEAVLEMYREALGAV